MSAAPPIEEMTPAAQSPAVERAVAPPALPVPAAQPAALPPASALAPASILPRTRMVSAVRIVWARSLPMMQYQFNRVGRSGLAGAAMSLFAAIFLFAAVLPQQREISALRAELRDAQRRGPDLSPHLKLNRFLDNLPRRSELPSIAGKIFKLAQGAGVTLERGRYELTPLHSGHLARYRMSFPIKGSYPSIRQFIDSTLTAIPSAAVDGFRIERKAVGDANVDADLRFSIFVRNES